MSSAAVVIGALRVTMVVQPTLKVDIICMQFREEVVGTDRMILNHLNSLEILNIQRH